MGGTNGATLLKKVKAELQVQSMSQLATALGYRSQASINYWLSVGEVPKIAIPRVKKYFETKGARQ